MLYIGQKQCRPQLERESRVNAATQRKRAVRAVRTELKNMHACRGVSATNEAFGRRERRNESAMEGQKRAA
jgi:hypothetical protein